MKQFLKIKIIIFQKHEKYYKHFLFIKRLTMEKNVIFHNFLIISFTQRYSRLKTMLIPVNKVGYIILD